MSSMRFEQAVACEQRGELARADAICVRLLRARPDHCDAWHLRGVLALQQSDLERAIAYLRKSLALNDRQPSVHANVGVALLRAGRGADAVVHFERALDLTPADHALLLLSGDALFDLGRHEEALLNYDRAALLVEPGVGLLNNRGNALRELARHEAALVSFRRALALDPQQAEIWNNIGNVLLDMNRTEEALTHYDAALALRPGFTNALDNRGLALTMLGRPHEAAQAYAQLCAEAPDYPLATSNLFHARAACCDWGRREPDADTLVRQVSRGVMVQPSVFMAASDSAPALHRCTVAFSAARIGTGRAMWSGERYAHTRLRVAYLSADFRRHAVSYAMAGVWERHDRARFETIAVSFKPEDPHPIGRRVRAAFDRFHVVWQTSDREIAELVRSLEIDIAVDLMGLTRWCRPGIFAHRPAPVQVNFLGYPGSMGSQHWDYLVADESVIPQYEGHSYTEQIVRLPNCFLPTDDRRASIVVPSRAAQGLPELGLVFCAFTNAYKIAPPMFDVWMRLLRETPGSVLWLRDMGSAARSNLADEARRRAVDAARLVFAPHVDDMAEHLSRQALADLYLDTHPYNAHSTAADALWAGVPVLTCRGNSLASRVASSALAAVGLSELVTDGILEYESLALALAQNAPRLSMLRSKLATQRAGTTLFDTARYTRALETAYLRMHQESSRRARSERPAHHEQDA